MKIFLDSADIDEIIEVKKYGLLDGVTTNPSLLKKAVTKHKKKNKNLNLEKYIRKLLRVAKGVPVSLEVIGTNYEEIIREGKLLHKKFNSVANNVVVKIPVNPCFSLYCPLEMDGIRAIKELKKKKILVNTTLIFTPEQAFLAAKAGAKYVSPFVGRIDDALRKKAGIKFEKTDYYPKAGLKKGKKLLSDMGIESGVDLISETRTFFDKQKIKSQILAASIRNTRQFREVAESGADVATLPLAVIKKLVEHEKTAEGMKKFEADIIPEYAELLGRRKKKK